MMRFGEILRNIRETEKDSQRALAEPAKGFGSGYISEVECGKRRPNEELLLIAMKRYPLHKDELANAFINEYIPVEILENMKYNKETMIAYIDRLTENLSEESKLEIFGMLLKLLEAEHLKNGTYDKAAAKIKMAKNLLEKKNVL